jgi:hypothetical protein
LAAVISFTWECRNSLDNSVANGIAGAIVSRRDCNNTV